MDTTDIVNTTYAIIFLIVLVLAIIYLKCRVYEPMLINKQLYCHNPINGGATTIHHSKFSKPYLGTNFSFNFWIYIENTPENVCSNHSQDNFIDIFRTVKNHKEKFKLQFNPHSGDMKLILDDNDNGYDIIKALPNQKWMNISINIENKYIDIFVNGKLYNAFYSPTIIKFIPNIPMEIICDNGGFYGYLSKFRYFNKFINYKRVKTLYQNNIRESGSYDPLWWIR